MKQDWKQWNFAGFDGGLPTDFLMEMYDTESMELRSSISQIKRTVTRESHIWLKKRKSGIRTIRRITLA